MPAVKIPMTTASGLGPLPEVLERRAGSKALARAFEEAGLPLQLVEERHHKLPLQAMVDVFHAAEKQAADPMFGLHVGIDMQPGAYGMWLRYSSQARTLREALTRLGRTFWVHQSGGKLCVLENGSHATWTYHAPGTGTLHQRAHADHTVPVMLKVLRAFMGPDWLPDRIGVPFEDDHQMTARRDHIACEWTFCAPGVSFTFPAECLERRRFSDPTGVLYTDVEVFAEKSMVDMETATGAIREVIALRLLDGRTDIDGAAKLSQQSVRSLQRKLDQYGCSYSNLLAQTRMERASALLRDSDLSVTAIGLGLGFSDPTNFTRAFRRWTGQSPSDYRKSTSGAPRRSP